MSEQSDHSLINFIAATVETMREQMATKDDIVRLESRMEAMRESLESRMDSMDARINSIDSRMDTIDSRMDALVTKEDLRNSLASIREEMATKDDLARLATTVRGDFEQVHFRFDTLERVMNTRFDKEKRISVVCAAWFTCLYKDQFDLLRLLGQPTPREIRP